jgi:cyanophycin synthetase
MKILSFRTNLGPNVYHSCPTIIMTVDLGKWNDVSSKDVEGFVDQLWLGFPGLVEHPSGLGTWLAPIA